MECNVSDKLYIDRTAAIMTAMNYDGNGNAQDASQDIASALSALPAADVREVMRGRWLGGETSADADGFPVYDTLLCSVCGMEWDAQEAYCAFNFCPNCGADMRETEPQKCDTCQKGAHWDGIVVCAKDGQRHERNETCKEG